MRQAGQPRDRLAERTAPHARPIQLLRRGIHGTGWTSRVPAVLAELGLEATRVLDESFEPSPDAVLWISGSPNWYPCTLRRLAFARPHERPTVMLWHSEPLPPPRGSGLPRPRLHAREIAKIVLRDRRATDPYTNAWRLRWLARRGLPGLLVVSSRDKQEYLEEIGLRAEFVPLGWHSSYGSDLGLERDIDVLFLGGLDVPRRKRAFRRLRAAGVDLVTLGSWKDPEYWGESRTQLLNRARIMLNISRHPGQVAGQRLILGAAHGVLVVSEPMHRPEPWVAGEHYVSATLEEMPAAVAHYLEHEDERRRIAARALELATTELSLERSILRLLELLEEAAVGR